MRNPFTRGHKHDDQHEADEHGTDGGGSASRDPQAPFEPHPDDNSPLGDTDEHSDA